MGGIDVDPLDFIPYYGMYHALGRVGDRVDSGEISFGQGVAEAVLHGMIGGLGIGISLVHFPSPGEVYGARAIVMASPYLSAASIPVVLAAANFAVIESAPREQQQGLWQMFASGLTGTVGIGSGGSSFV